MKIESIKITTRTLPNITYPTRLMPWKMYEIIENIICFNCDINYSKRNKYSEKKSFYIDCEDEGDPKLEKSTGLEKQGKFQRYTFRGVKILEDKHLYLDPSKCAFGMKEYLGQFVAHEGFEVDANKIQSMMEWIVPKNLKNIR